MTSCLEKKVKMACGLYYNCKSCTFLCPPLPVKWSNSGFQFMQNMYHMAAFAIRVYLSAICIWAWYSLTFLAVINVNQHFQCRHCLSAKIYVWEATLVMNDEACRWRSARSFCQCLSKKRAKVRVWMQTHPVNADRFLSSSIYGVALPDEII